MVSVDNIMHHLLIISLSYELFLIYIYWLYRYW